jgi:phosphatidate cytidylyltransferase
MRAARPMVWGQKGGNMAADTMVWTLFAGVVGLLILATAGGFALRRRYGNTDAIANFNSRTFAWWVMVAIMAVAFLTGRTGTILLYALASGIALYEFMVLTAARAADRVALTAAFTVLLPIQYALIWTEWYGLFAIFIPVYGFLVLPIL